MQSSVGSGYVCGRVGEVYTTPTSDVFVDIPEDGDGEYLEGWMQKVGGVRVRVVRRRTSHSSCAWFPVQVCFKGPDYFGALLQ